MSNALHLDEQTKTFLARFEEGFKALSETIATCCKVDVAAIKADVAAIRTKVEAGTTGGGAGTDPVPASTQIATWQDGITSQLGKVKRVMDVTDSDKVKKDGDNLTGKLKVEAAKLIALAGAVATLTTDALATQMAAAKKDRTDNTQSFTIFMNAPR
jgi:hypothetical protein